MSKSDLVGATEATKIIGCSRAWTNIELNNGKLVGRFISDEFWVIERAEAERYKTDRAERHRLKLLS